MAMPRLWSAGPDGKGPAMWAFAALGLFAVLMLVIGAWRRRIQVARTGDSGNRRRWRPDATLEWWALALADVGYLLVGIAAPAAALAGTPALGIVERPWVHAAGAVVAVVGITATLLAQLGLGASWRIGVEETETTDLVTTGPFALVRNPIFTALLFTLTGLALMVPNPVAVVGLVVAVAGIELQVRGVEEPYLRRVHGHAYSDYTTAVGRFVPTSAAPEMRPMMLPDTTTDFNTVEVTVAFVDLAGYSVLTEACGDREAAQLATRLVELAHTALQPGVRVVKTIGDAVMLAADTPAQMTATIIDLADRVAGEDGFLPIRAGIHHGPAIARGGDFFGHVVNIAARITALAGAGQGGDHRRDRRRGQ